MIWYEAIIAAHRVVTDDVSHCKRLKSRRYFVWQEENSRSLRANDRPSEKIVSGSTDLYTPIEFDPWAEALGEALSDAGIAWDLSGVDYEEETGLWHYEWTWEVCYGQHDVQGDG